MADMEIGWQLIALREATEKFRGETLTPGITITKERAEEFCVTVMDALQVFQLDFDINLSIVEELRRRDSELVFPEDGREAIRNLLLEVLKGPDASLRKRIQNLCDLLLYRTADDGFLRTVVLFP